MRILLLAALLLAATPIMTVSAQDAAAQLTDRSGMMKGMVTMVDPDKGRLSVKTLQGEFAFIPRWVGGMPKDGGGFDRDMLGKLGNLCVGDYVEIAWERDEHLRVVKLGVLGRKGGPHQGGGLDPKPAAQVDPCAAPAADRLASLATTCPPAESGVVRGTVTAVDPKGRLVVKTTDGGEEAFLPPWKGGLPNEGGGFDQTVVAQIAKLKPGQQVEISWAWNERKRCVGIAAK